MLLATIYQLLLDSLAARSEGVAGRLAHLRHVLLGALAAALGPDVLEARRRAGAEHRGAVVPGVGGAGAVLDDLALREGLEAVLAGGGLVLEGAQLRRGQPVGQVLDVRLGGDVDERLLRP